MATASRGNVLFFSGDVAARLEVRAAVSDMRLQLVEAESLQSALKECQSGAFDLFLIDSAGNAAEAFEVAKAIRRARSGRVTPLLFLIDGGKQEQFEEAYALGAFDALDRRLAKVALPIKIRTLLELPHAPDEAEQLQLVVQKTSEYAIFMLDPEGRVATWNAGAERLKGYSRDEIIGEHFSKFYPQEAIDRGWPQYELEVAQQVGSFEDEGWRLRKDGSRFWANVVITALRDDQGRLRGFSKVTRDLTARKEAEERLRRSEERLRLLVETVTDYAIFLLDPGGHIATWNPGAERIKGYRADEIIGQHFSTFYPQEANDRGWPAYELKVAADVGRFEDEGWRVRKDGSQFWANVVITALKDEHGHLHGFSKITRDLTERKKSEEAARELAAEQAARKVAEESEGRIRLSEARLKLFVEHAPAAVAMFDRDMRYLLVSQRWLTDYGLKQEKVIGHSHYEVFPDLPERWKEVHRRCLAGASERCEEDSFPRESGERGWLRWEVLPWTAASGEIGGLLIFSEDITERKRAEAAIQEQREWLAVTLASIGDAVIATDEQGRISYLNDVAQNLTGWTLREAEGKPLDSVFVILNEYTRATVENPVEKVLREGVIVGLGNHTILIAKDGTERPIDDSAAPIRSTDGKLIGVVLIFRDVTEQRRAELELQSRDARNRAIVETALDCIITMDHEGRVVEFNPAAEQTFGYRAEEIIGKDLGDSIIPAAFREGHRRGMAHYLATGEGPVLGRRLEMPARRADGSEFQAELAITQSSLNGTPLFTAYLRDISGRKRDEAQRNARLAVTAALTLAVSPDKGAEQVLAAVCTHLGWDVGLFWALNDEATALECRTSWHIPKIEVEHFVEASCSRTFSRDEGLPGRVWATGKPAWILDLASEANFPRLAAASEDGVRSAFAYPVLAGERPLGVIEFFSREPTKLDEGLLEVMGTVAGTFGQFLERRKAEERLREQTANAATLLRISGLLSRELDLHKLVQVVTDEGTQLTGAEFGAFFYNVVGADGDSYMLYTISGVPKEAFEQFPMPRSTALFGPTFRGEGIVRLDDVTKSPLFGKSEPYYGMPPGHLPVRSYLAVPVTSRTGEVLGGLFFGHSECGVFTAQHERLMEGIAAQAAVAIDNARLYQSTQATADRLNLALSAAELGDWSWDAASDVVTFSERAAEVFGIAPGPNMTWTAMQSLLHEEDRDRAKQEVERVVTERAPYDIEYRVSRPDGSQVWIGVLGRATYNDTGEVVGMFGVVQDITDRKKMESSLRASEGRFRGLMEQAPFSVQLFSPQGQTLQVNRAWEELWGVTLPQIDGYNILEDRQLAEKGVLHLIHRAFAGEPTFIPAIRYDPNETIPNQTRYSDPVRWVAAVAYPLKDEAGRVREVVLVHDDITATRQAETALRESEEKLRLLADTIPQLAWMAQPDGHIFWYNRRWYDYTGTTPEAMEGWGWQSVHDPKVLPDVVSRWNRSLETGEPFDMVFPLRGADGKFRQFLTRVNPLRNERGEVIYWFGTNTDITELREARVALADSEERLRLALEAGRMGVWDWNVRTGELKWSDSLEPLHGLAPGTFGGTFEHFQELIVPEDRDAVNASIRNALETSGEFYIEFRNRWLNGGVHWIAGSGKVFRGDDGQPARMIGVGLDVTRRKRSEETARFLADASAALALLVDFDSTLQKVASLAVPAFADWVAVDVLDDERTLRRVAVAHVDPVKVQLAQDLHRRFPPDPSSANGAWEIVRTGSSVLVPELTEELLTKSIRDPEQLSLVRQLGLRSYIGVPLTVRGRTMGVLTFIVAESGHEYDENDLAVAQDLAHRAAIAVDNSQLYREMREADQRKDEFLATLAHELRNPLAPIRNGLQVLRLTGPQNQTVTEARQMMDRQLTQLVRLVDDLLDVSRITRNKLELRVERVALSSVIHSAIETSRPLIEQFGHTFSVTLTPTPVYVDADPVRLAQVLSNLLNNAAKYTEPGGRITLAAEVEGKEAVIEVADTGMGIPPEFQPKIFDMFAQVDRNLERAQGGLGIGLTLVRRLVEMHRGTVAVQSDGPGMGSKFIVRLPIAEGTVGTVSSSLGAEGTSAGPKRRILVVDDNRDAAQSLAMLLKLMGNEVFTADDGLAAVTSAEELRPDMILLDIGLPKLNGYDACRQIRSLPWAQATTIIALTGWGQEEDRRRSQEAGFDHHLVKPVDVAKLTALVSGSSK